jgi:hypothetical protein
MAKKNSTTVSFDYTNEEVHSLLINLFSKVNPNITIEEAIEAHKALFNDPTKPVMEEDILNYFNK